MCYAVAVSSLFSSSLNFNIISSLVGRIIASSLPHELIIKESKLLELSLHLKCSSLTISNPNFLRLSIEIL